MDRRTVVVGLASLGGSAALLLSGCGPTRGAAGGPTAGEGESPDTRLVAAALDAELVALDVLERTRRRHPGLRAATDVAVETHRAHVKVLRGTTGKPATKPSERAEVPGRPQLALAALTRSEAQVSAGHVATAMAARSGALARLVASMAAASAQLEQVLAGAASGAGSDSGSGEGG